MAESHDPQPKSTPHSQSEPDHHLRQTQHPAPNDAHHVHAQITSQNHAHGNRNSAPPKEHEQASERRRPARHRPGHPTPMLARKNQAGAPGRAQNAAGRGLTREEGAPCLPRRPGRVSSRGGGARRDLGPGAGEIGARAGAGRCAVAEEVVGDETRWWKWGGRGRERLKQKWIN